jgi:5'/3'-nucleotidase SurE
MSWILLGNDDGADSPALIPFANALEAVLDLPVRICVPSSERSWSGKAVTRMDAVQTHHVRRDGRDVVAVDGTPADAIQIGMYGMFAEAFLAAPPSLVVTGINLGYNHGTGFMSSSGTVWAALEAGLAGVPAIAVSTGDRRDYAGWRIRSEDGSDETRAGWDRVAAVAAETVLRIGTTDLIERCDAVSVNMPWDVTRSSKRRVTQLSPLTYGPLFDPTDTPGEYRFTQDLSIYVDHDHVAEDGDVRTIADDTISITPLLLPASTRVPERTRVGIEQD